MLNKKMDKAINAWYEYEKNVLILKNQKPSHDELMKVTQKMVEAIRLYQIGS